MQVPYLAVSLVELKDKYTLCIKFSCNSGENILFPLLDNTDVRSRLGIISLTTQQSTCVNMSGFFQ